MILVNKEPLRKNMKVNIPKQFSIVVLKFQNSKT
jgi:hypothetical protein